MVYFFRFSDLIKFTSNSASLNETLPYENQIFIYHSVLF